MSFSLSSLTSETIVGIVQDIFDVIVVWWIIYNLIKIIRTSQKTIQLFQGVLVVIILLFVSEIFGLTTVNWLANNIVSWGVIAIIVIFQPEIRAILERIGKSNALARITTLSSSEKEKLIDELIEATMVLSETKTGAIISLEQSQSLADYINTGVQLNSVVSAELITSIFTTTTTLHDGAVIIQGDKMACASAYFPPTSRDLPSRYGARHRAAIGISEVTDAVTIVVSEETGAVSLTQNGRLISMTPKKLREKLESVILNTEQVQAQRSKTIRKESVSVDSFVEDKKPLETDDELMGNHREQKTFITQSFSVVEDEEERDLSMVESLIDSAMNENTIDPSVTVRKVATSKEADNTNIIKTFNVTTPTVDTVDIETVDTLEINKSDDSKEVE